MVEIFLVIFLAVLMGCMVYDKWVKPVWVPLNTKAPQKTDEIRF